MLAGLGWDSLASRWKASTLTMTYKILEGEVDVPVSTYFEYRFIKVCTAHDCQLRRYQPHGEVDKNSFAYSLVPERNSLQTEVVSAGSLDLFKELLAEHLRSD